MKKNYLFLKALFILVILSIIVVAIGAYFISYDSLIGLAFLVAGLFSIGILKLSKLELRSVYPDIIFGAIDNGVLIFATVLGGVYAGVFGAVIGGAAGNTITDGIGGLFEGRMAERLRIKNIFSQRTSLSSMLGKMIGCLLGAGVGLILVWLISLL